MTAAAEPRTSRAPGTTTPRSDAVRGYTAGRVTRIGGLSLRWRPRSVVTCVSLALLVVALTAVSVSRGSTDLPLTDVLAVFAGGGDRLDRFVVLQLRMPRALTAVLVGLALGLSGAITQAVTRNPLASPDVLGITAGAGTAAVAVIVLGGGTVTGVAGWLGVPLAALVGGLAMAAVLYLLAWRDGVDGYRLVLIGVALTALTTAVTAWLLTRAQISDAARATVWLTGSVNGRGWEHAVPVAVVLTLGAAGALAAARTLAALRFDDDVARALGVRLQTGRAVVMVLAVGVAAVATAAAGPIAFVALVAPQIALRLVRSAGSPLAASALTGAVVLAGADLVARTALPVELPVGVLTAVLGAPCLLVMLLTAARKAAV